MKFQFIPIPSLLFFAISLFSAEPLSLLVIQTDEHHFKTLGSYGGRIVQTPHIDWIGNTGAIATSFYATSPVCSPSRGALVSGRYPQNTPVTNNNIRLGDDIITFAEILHRKGYATGFGGKWHLDGDGKPQWAPKRKFGFEDNRFMFNRGHWKMFEDTPEGPRVASRKNNKADYGLKGADEKSFATDWLADKAIDFINTNRGKPFCYMLSLPDPHGPNTVRAPYDNWYQDVTVPIPRSLDKTLEQTPRWGMRAPRITADTVRTLMPKYYGMVKCIDDNVGRILGALRRNGQIDNTLIVLTSDHGDLCGEHGRLNKGVPYEGSARIPFLLRCPGKVPAGTVVNQALSCVDFLPTVLKLMDVKTAGKEQGRDASSLFTGEAKDWKDVTCIRSTSGGKPWLCAVSDRYKLVLSSEDRPWLFDLQSDPDELNNRADDPGLKKVVRSLAGDLNDYCREFKDPHGDDPAIRKALNAILTVKN
ncbi:MAG: sulfatase [Opitutae bacterium]|jgi:arylsulfatase A-like enzyme|nr:sulfatase [Opitutae bacterium]MBT5379273.1 sulfatase [Opitutae bacterium]MBT5691391.1 sulfatase [Opitutae bacterium]MBT6461593.1 sulfatase [Opitutae bacterium]MBT7854213.1 sulfatase [Opitutae bacterium]